MEELVLEDAIIKGHPGAFNGLIRVKRIRLLNCRWGGRRRRKGNKTDRKNGKKKMDENGGGIEEM
jgi:hypothetical protein